MKLTEGPIAKTMFFFTLPILAGNVLQSLNGSINAIWIGRFLGEKALTASANANALLFLLIGLMFGAGMATTILIGQNLGRKNVAEAKKVLGTSITFFGLISAGIAVFGSTMAPWFLHLMHTPADSLPLAAAYLRILFLGVPSIYLYTLIMMALRGAGDSKTPFVFLLVSVGLDIGLNPLLIFGWGPLPAFGIAGSATASLVAQMTSLVLLLMHLHRKNHPLFIHKNELHLFRMDRTILRSLVVKGFPMGLQMIIISGSMIMMIRLVNTYGSQTAAAYGAGLQLWNYVQMPAFAVGQAATSMAAQNVGAKLWDRVDRVALVGVGFNFLLVGVLIGIIYTFNAPALSLFLRNGEALDIAMHLNAIVLWSFLFFGVSFVLGGVMRSTGAVVPPLIILFVSMWIVRFPFAYFLAERMKADSIWWSFVVGSLTSVVLSGLYYRFGPWKKARMIAPAAVAEPA